MRDNFHLLAHALKVKFRLPPNRPTDDELQSIVEEVVRLQNVKRLLRSSDALTDAEWEEIVLRYVKFTGRYIYEGLDHSDLNRILAQLAAEARSSVKK